MTSGLLLLYGEDRLMPTAPRASASSCLASVAVAALAVVAVARVRVVGKQAIAFVAKG